MQPADPTAELHAYLAHAFDGLDRGIGLAHARLLAPRRYDPARAGKAIDALIAQLAGYAIGLVAASIAGALARHADPATAAAVRAELARIAATPTARRPPPPADLDRELRPRVLAADDLRDRLRERVVHARIDAHAVVSQLVAVAGTRDRSLVSRVLGAMQRDDLVPYRFGERIEASWRQTCDALADDRMPGVLAAPPPPPREEPAENYPWMRIR